MTLDETLRAATQAIRANAMRSALTVLGVVIGIAAVIAMLAIGAGARHAVQSRIAQLGPTLLSIHPGQGFLHGVATGTHAPLTLDDDTALAAHARYITDVVPEISSDFQVDYGDHNASIRVIGTTPAYVPVQGFHVAYGRVYSRGEGLAHRRLAVLGAAVPRELEVDPATMVGGTILIRGVPFTVVGVLADRGSQGGWENPDDQILVPFRTARYRIMGTTRLRTITVRVDTVSDLNLAMIEIEEVLRARHRLAPGAPDDFHIFQHGEVLATFESTARTFAFLLGGIAAVSLLVGGIGIMNIMLVSVTERTREIGTRRALGARRADILLQFLAEAVLLCAVGGILGVASGVTVAHLVSRLAHWNTLVAPASVVLALAVSVAVGLGFGLWPARNAARLDPVEALRFE